jgi:hypothetical protein
MTDNPLAIADRIERAVGSCRQSAMATGGAKWVKACDEMVAALRAIEDAGYTITPTAVPNSAD